MQNKYAGDIGDYVKLALLRALQPEKRVGVAWWLFPDEHETGDGQHVAYLENPQKWRRFDPALFDGLERMVSSNRRSVRAIQDAGFLSNAVFCEDILSVDGTTAERASARTRWFHRVRQAMAGCNLVFLDPDNGLEPATFSFGKRAAGKSVALSELSSLNEPGRTLLVYHHQTRRKGGHLAEIDHWADRLRALGFASVDAIRSSAYSPRAFLLLNADASMRARAQRLTENWDGYLTWHPDGYLAQGT